LRRIAGLGVNIMQVYDDAKCYMNGFFNAIEAFWSDWDPKGWWVQNSVDAVTFFEFGHDSGEGSLLDAQGDYPLLTPVTSEFLLHIEALQNFLQGNNQWWYPFGQLTKENYVSFAGMLLVRVLEVQLNAPMGLWPHKRGCGILSLQKEGWISRKLKIRLINFSTN
jgi:hypothetical protein